MKKKEFIAFFMIICCVFPLWLSALYVLYVLFDFPLLMNIGPVEYIPRALIVLVYFHNIQKLAKRISRKFKIQSYETFF